MFYKKSKVGLAGLMLMMCFLLATTGAFASGPTRNQMNEISADFSKVSYDGNFSEIYNELKEQGWELQCDAFEKTVLQVKDAIAKMAPDGMIKSSENTEVTPKDVGDVITSLNKEIQAIHPDANVTEGDKIYTEGICDQLNNKFTAADYKIPQHFGYAVGENVINDRKVYVIAFRGTYDTYSWIFTDFLAFPTEFLDTGTKVHVGFEWNRQACMKRDILKYFINNKVLKDTSNPLLIITGHSMGAALAVLETAYFIEKTSFSSKNIKLITLAEPCPGRKDFVELYQPQIKYYRWFWNFGDLVPALPMVVKYKHFDLLSLRPFNVGPKVKSLNDCFERHDLKYYREYIYSLDDKNKI